MKLSLVAAVALLLVGCVAPEMETEHEASEMTTSELNPGCVESNFNCKLPDHAFDEKDRNRFFTPDGNIKWKIKPGTTALDGQGNVVGAVTSSTIEINYGQRKSIKGAPHVFGFRFTITGDVPASAWIPEAAVVGDTSNMPTVRHGNPGRADDTVFEITGGDPNTFKDAKGRNLKISKAGTGNLEANDYLVRPSGTVHLLYSVPGFQIGGLATDTLRADQQIQFIRSKSVPAIEVPTFTTTGAAGPKMKFLYGRVGTSFGWIARDALN